MAVRAIEIATPYALVITGTDHHRFDRLVHWADLWASASGLGHRVLVQHGTADGPHVAEGTDYLPHELLEAHASAATIGICHAGPGSVMGLRRGGLHPIVVPRDPALGEHVDRHQLEFARTLVDQQLAEIAYTYDELVDAVERVGSLRRLSSSIPSIPSIAPGVSALAEVVDDLLGVTRAKAS